ncbi:MAG: hypothetical protein HFG48_01495 [Bacilli bacterium]|nr:hypothetical protein [Bacilli bacterium]
MGNDVIYTDLSQVDYSINQLESLCNQQQVENNKEVERIIEKLTTESWAGATDTEAFKNKFAEYQENLRKMSYFYSQVIDDLRSIRVDMEDQMQSRPNIHTDGF